MSTAGSSPSWVKITTLTVLTAMLAVLATLLGGTREAQAADITVPSAAVVGGFAGGQQVSAADGLIYLPGNQDHIIRVYQAPMTASSTPVRTITAADGLQYPLGVHVHNGLLYVTNDGVYEGGAQGSGWVSVFTAGGAGTSNTELRRISGVDRPHDIATDDHYMYVTAFRNSRILVYPLTATGRATPVRTITGLNNPVGLTISGGNIYTANKAANTITVHTAGHSGSTTPVRTIAGDLAWPTSVAVVNDHVLAINQYNNTVTAHRTTDNGNATAQWRLSGSPGISSGHGIEILDNTILVSEWSGATAKNLRTYPLPINPDPVRTMGVTDGPLESTDAVAVGNIVYAVDYAAGRIHRYDVGTGARTEIATVSGNARSIAVDATHVYWTDGRYIGRANLDGTGTNGTFLDLGHMHFAHGLEVSDTGIYWTNWEHTTIERTDLNGANRTTVVSGLPIRTINRIAVDAEGVYWSDYNAGTIGRAALDGTGKNTTWITGQTRISGLEVSAGQIYWGLRDAQQLRAADLATGTVRTISPTIHQINGVSVSGDDLYWTAIGTGKISRIRTDGSDPVTVAPAGLAGSSVAFDVVVPGDGFVYVSDPGADRILVYPAGRTGSPHQVREIRHPALTDPHGLAVDVEARLLYVANQTYNVGGENIQVFRSGGAGTPNDEVRRISTTAAAACNFDPTAVAVSGDELFVSSFYGNRICVFRAGGAEQTNNDYVRVISAGSLSNPIGIVVHEGNVYVSNRGTNSVLVYPVALTSNVASRTISGMTSGTEELAIGTFNGQERLFVASGSATNTISAYPLDANGATSPTMIVTGESRARVSFARGIAINDGLLYVANTSEPKGVRVFAPEPQLTAVSPDTGRPGATLTLTGENLTGTTAVRIAGIPTAFTVVSDTEITATAPMVPAGAATVEVLTGSGVARSVAAFTSQPPAPDDTLCLSAPALVNGSFETPSIPGSEWSPVSTDTAGVGWKNTAEGSIEVWKSGFNGVTAPQGAQFAEMNYTTAGTLYQDLATTPGQTLRWSLWHRARENTGTNTMRVVIGAPGGTLTQSGQDMTSGTAWVNYTGYYIVPDGQTTTRFAFQAVSPAGGAGNLLDDISFTVPGCADAPTAVTGTGVDGGVSLSFTPGADGADPITNYAYSVDDGPWTPADPARGTSPVTITGLTNNQSYSVRLRALNSTAAGRITEPVTVTAGGPNLGYGGAIPAMRTVASAGINAALGAEAKAAVNQFPGDSVRVVVQASAGSVALGNTTGLTAPTGYPGSFSGSEIAFTGTRAAVNAALDTLTYTAGTAAGTATIDIDAAAEFAGKVFNPDNGHYYEYVSTSMFWTTARDQAKARTFNGLPGYLATITSAEENAFVTSKTGGAAAWIGGSDANVEGAWEWVDGPEAGQVFWTSACGIAFVGVCPATGMFNSFSASEPNDHPPLGGEDALEILAGGNGRWNDLPSANNHSYLRGYVVEYSEPDGAPPAGVSASRTLTVPVRAAGVTDDACVAAPGLVNGDFEATFPEINWLGAGANPSTGPGYKLVPQGSQNLGWSNTAVYEGQPDRIELWTSGFNGVTAPSGNQFAELNALVAGTFYQDLATTPGQTLRWSLSHRATPNSGATNTMRVVIGAAGGTLTQSGSNLVSGSAWTKYTGTYTVPAGQTTTRFAFQAVSPVADNGNLIDDIRFTTVGCAAAPSNVTVAAGDDGFANVSFTPGDNGGYDLTNYAVSINGGPWSELPTPDATPPLTVTGLELGRDYTIAVRPLNAAGLGQATGAFSVRMPTIDDQANLGAWKSIAMGADGSLYVATRDTGRILVFAPGTTGNTAPVRTITGAATGLSGKPHGIAVAADGTIYVTSHYTDEILVFAPGANGDAAPTRRITTPGLDGPHGIALDAAGNRLWVASQLGRAIYALPASASGSTTPLRTLTGPSTGLTNPRALALSPAGQLYVTDNAVRVFDTTTSGNRTPSRVLPTGNETGLDTATGLTIDPQTGTVYVANPATNSIRAYAPTANGNVRPVRILRGADTGLNNPTSLTIHTDTNGTTRLWAANPGNGSIRAFTLPDNRR